MAGHSRSKNGVASLAYARHPSFYFEKSWITGQAPVRTLSELTTASPRTARMRRNNPSPAVQDPAPPSRREPGEPDHAGDHRRRGEHDADLEGGRRQFVMVIFRHRHDRALHRRLGLFGRAARGRFGSEINARPSLSRLRSALSIAALTAGSAARWLRRHFLGGGMTC